MLLLLLHVIELTVHRRFDNSYITWINNGHKVWSLKGAGMAADPLTQVRMPKKCIDIVADLHSLDLATASATGTYGVSLNRLHYLADWQLRHAAFSTSLPTWDSRPILDTLISRI